MRPAVSVAFTTRGAWTAPTAAWTRATPARRMLNNALREELIGARAYARAHGLRREGSLPDFLIVGAQRCGTTSLFRYLAEHPQVRPGIGKELQYFSLHYQRGERWYRGHFPSLDVGQVTFEASPYYLFHPSVPDRVAATLPHAKFIALLRDPVDRAYSHYLHSRAHGVEPLSFEEAIEAEPRRLEMLWGRAYDERGGRNPLRCFSYVSRGLYAEQLERWLERFPRESLLVVRSEDMYQDPARTYAGVLDFLELDAFLPSTLKRHNHWRDGASTQLTPSMRRRLHSVFEPHNERLARLVGWPQAW